MKGRPLAAAAAELPSGRRLGDPRARRPAFWMRRLRAIEDEVDRHEANSTSAWRKLATETSMPTSSRAPGARPRGVELRRGQRADRAPQPQLPRRGAAPDGSADARLREDQRPRVRARAARRASGSSGAGPPISSGVPRTRDPAARAGRRRGARGALRREPGVPRPFEPTARGVLHRGCPAAAHRRRRRRPLAVGDRGRGTDRRDHHARRRAPRCVADRERRLLGRPSAQRSRARDGGGRRCGRVRVRRSGPAPRSRRGRCATTTRRSVCSRRTASSASGSRASC